jgi:hypothetical protein
MTTPEVDQELERLFSVVRAATVPDSKARERIHAGIAPRLAAGAPRGSSSRAKFGVGLALLGVGAAALWFMRAPAANVTLPIAPRVSLPVAPVVEVMPPTAAVVTAPSAAAKPAPEASRPTPALPRSANPAEELSLVRAMQQALRAGNPSQALALAADHARRFPRGTLLEEREGVRAVAQCQLAAPGARAAVLDSFTRHFATSPYAARVKAACQ